VLQLNFLFIHTSFSAWCSCPHRLLQCVKAVAHLQRKLKQVQHGLH